MRLSLMLLLLLLASRAFAQAALTVDVVLSDPKAGGSVMLAVCPDAGPFGTDKGCLVRRAAAASATVRVPVGELPPGPHAIKVFHDVNGNGKLDTNWMGIPNEPYGFGNDARGSFGPPSFEQSAVTLGQAPKVAVVLLK
jgi:uncharacterized protein (DUF2141 family)